MRDGRKQKERGSEAGDREEERRRRKEREGGRENQVNKVCWNVVIRPVHLKQEKRKKFQLSSEISQYTLASP